MAGILDPTQKVSESIKPTLPFYVKLKGDLKDSEFAELQSRIADDDNDPWGLEYTFTDSDKTCVIPGISEEKIEFRGVVPRTGFEVLWGIAQVSFPAR